MAATGNDARLLSFPSCTENCHKYAIHSAFCYASARESARERQRATERQRDRETERQRQREGGVGSVCLCAGTPQQWNGVHAYTAKDTTYRCGHTCAGSHCLITLPWQMATNNVLFFCPHLCCCSRDPANTWAWVAGCLGVTEQCELRPRQKVQPPQMHLAHVSCLLAPILIQRCGFVSSVAHIGCYVRTRVCTRLCRLGDAVVRHCPRRSAWSLPAGCSMATRCAGTAECATEFQTCFAAEAGADSDKFKACEGKIKAGSLAQCKARRPTAAVCRGCVGPRCRHLGKRRSLELGVTCMLGNVTVG